MSTDRFRSLRSRMSEAADAAMIEAADADGRLRDDPLTDCPVDEAAAAERERSAKAAKLAAQTANAMVAVQGQLKLRGQAADKAAHDANAEAGAPVKASSMMVERVFVARLDGPDRYMVARRKERKTAAGAGTAVEVVAGLEKMANSAVGMVLRESHANGVSPSLLELWWTALTIPDTQIVTLTAHTLQLRHDQPAMRRRCRIRRCVLL